jgi:Kinesin motor domain
VQSESTNVHVPYRDSKLTKLLMDSIGGSALCLMVACVAPSSNYCDETLNTLMYATRAKRITNKPRVQMDPHLAMMNSMKQEIELLRNENEYLRSMVVRPQPPAICCNSMACSQFDPVRESTGARGSSSVNGSTHLTPST